MLQTHMQDTERPDILNGDLRCQPTALASGDLITPKKRRRRKFFMSLSPKRKNLELEQNTHAICPQG